MLCCVALRCVALRCVALRCVALRCVALRCVVVWCVVFCCDVMLVWCVVMCYSKCYAAVRHMNLINFQLTAPSNSCNISLLCGTSVRV